MKIKEPTFLELLESFFTERMPLTSGLSDNTVRLYKATFRLLMRFLYEKKGIETERITFQMLTCAEVSEFLNWLEAERKSSVATRNIRLAALSSFASYAQNRNSDAAIVFLSGLRRIPAKKTVYFGVRSPLARRNKSTFTAVWSTSIKRTLRSV